MSNWKRKLEDKLRKEMDKEPMDYLDIGFKNSLSKYPPLKLCTACNGRGAISNGQTGEPEQCPICLGEGEILE